MKRFLFQIVLFSIPIFAFIYITALIFGDGKTDYYYLRFTSPKQENLILGTSKAAQGIIPSILDSNFNRKFFNFSFNLSISPYGKQYYNAIKKKLNPKTQNGIFILTVDVFNLTSLDLKKEELITEEKLGSMHFMNWNPNIEYLFKNDIQPWKYNTDESINITNLHKNGWLEVNYPFSKERYIKNLESKINDYEKNQLRRTISPMRLAYLEKTIQLLQKHGTVYLVRIPTAKEMLDIENQIYPDLNQKITSIAQKYNLNYFDFSLEYEIYQTTDGNHLYKPYAKKFTQALCDSIKNTIK